MNGKKLTLITVVTYIVSFAAAGNYYQADAALIDVKKRTETMNSAVSATELPGEQINLSTREVGWDVTDLSIPGQGPLIEIGRRHAATTPGWFDHWRREMYNWELSIPKIDLALWRYVEEQDPAKDLMNGCGYGNVRSMDVRIRGTGDFRPIAQNSAITYPSGVHVSFNNNWLLKCNQSTATRSVSYTATGVVLPAHVSNAIILLSPDGLTYKFSYHSIENKVLPDAPSKTINPEGWRSWSMMVNKVSSFYITDIEDRFGNYVSFHYEERPDNNNGTLLRLQRITASDGRLVNLEYQVDPHGQTGVSNSGRHLKRVVAGNQSVDYFYSSSSQQIPQLKRVTDGSSRAWVYNYYDTVATQNSLLKDISTPWGATVSYNYNAYSTLGACRHWIDGANAASVAQRRVHTGNEEYLYEYKGSAATIGTQNTWVTEVKSPSAREKFYHACYDVSSPDTAPEHAKALTLVRQEVFEGSNSETLLRRTDTNWDTIAYSGSVRRQRAVDLPISTLRLYKQKQIVTEDSGSYTTEWSLPDAYGLPIHTLKSSNQLTDKQYILQSYSHFPTAWLIGQPSRLALSSDGVNWVTQEQTAYYDINHAYKAKVYQVRHFGHLQKTFTSYHPDGAIKRIDYNDGNQRWLQLENYKFGIPQKIKLPQRYGASCTNPDTCFSEILQNINDDGWVSQVTDLNKNCINYGYDNVGRLKSIIHCDSRWSSTTFSYTNQENGTTFLETRGSYRKESIFDGLIREVSTKEWDVATPLDGRTVRRSFNNANNPLFVSYPSNYDTENKGTSYEYDALQRKRREYSTVNNKGIYWSYQDGNKVLMQDAKNHLTTTTYKALGEPVYHLPISIVQPEGAATTINYTPFDKISTVQQSNITELRRYNARQQLCLLKRPDTGITVYNYTSLGQVHSYAEGLAGNGEHCSDYINVASAWITHSYDNLGDIRSTAYADGSPNKSYTLDNHGNTKQLNSGSVVWDYNYNSAHLIESEILTVDSQSWLLDPSYNGLGHMSSLTYPSGTNVNYTPNALGQPTQAGSYATNVSYYPNGMLKGFTYGNGLAFIQNLDEELRPYEKHARSGTLTRVGQRYGYDDNDNLDSITDLTDSSKNVNLGFDGLDRLTTANGSWGAGSLSYDTVGNIKTKILGSQSLAYSYDSSNRLTAVTNGYNFSYDGRGTVTNNGKRSFSVNRAGHMTQSGNISYTYDGHNRRVKKTNSSNIQYSLYNQSGQFLATAGTNGATEYIYLGNQLVARVSQIATEEDKPGYTGHLEDRDIGLTYMQQRYYDPVIGRFYSNDPVGFSADNPMSFNRYLYVNNNPYKYTDPDGRNMIPLTSGQSGRLTVDMRPFWPGREGPKSEALAPEDSAGVALGTIGVAGSIASGGGLPAAVMLFVSLDGIRNSWTGNPTLTGVAAETVTSQFSDSKDTIEFAGKTGNFVQSTAGGGIQAARNVMKNAGNLGDAAGAASQVKDTASFRNDIQVYECSGRISCGEMRESTEKDK